MYEATWRGRRVAVKMLRCDSDPHYEALVKEVELSAALAAGTVNGPITSGGGGGSGGGLQHVVQLLGASLRDREHVALIMELMEGKRRYKLTGSADYCVLIK